MNLFVIIPAFNEEPRVSSVILEAKQHFPEARFVVVDDCSRDQTGRRSQEAGAEVISHPINLGAGATLETGYKYALRHGADVVIQIDGDGQHPPVEGKRILEPLLQDKADLVIGSRYLGPDFGYSTPFFRRLGQRFFSRVFLFLSGHSIADPTSGFKALNRKALSLFISGHYPDDYPDADILFMASKSGLRILEVPVRMVERTGGTSIHSGLKPFYYFFKMLLSLLMVYFRDFGGLTDDSR